MIIEPIDLSRKGTLEERIDRLERYIYRLVWDLRVFTEEVEEHIKPKQEEEYKRRRGI